jgi:hypothetical protein
MDHFDSLINRHLVGFAFHAHDCGQPLSKGLGSLSCWIVLLGPATHAQRLHDMSHPRVTASASQAQIVGCLVGFIAVDVGDHQAFR